MQWQDIRQHYPHHWLLVEAITAHSTAGKRVLEHLAVIDTFPDSVTAMKRYAQLYRDAPERELYVFHTSRETLDIVERQMHGLIRRCSRPPTAYAQLSLLDVPERRLCPCPDALRGAPKVPAQNAG